MIEIERKFIVRDEQFKVEASHIYRIRQGFLNRHPNRTVRVRLAQGLGYITIKGPGNDSGIARFELEYQIDPHEAEQLLALCEPGIIDKTRYEVPDGSHIWEVDVFHGDNQGLTLAEIELRSEDEAFNKPSWLGEEVSGQAAYYNSQLSKNPYKSWLAEQ